MLTRPRLRLWNPSLCRHVPTPQPRQLNAAHAVVMVRGVVPELGAGHLLDDGHQLALHHRQDRELGGGSRRRPAALALVAAIALVDVFADLDPAPCRFARTHGQQRRRRARRRCPRGRGVTTTVVGPAAAGETGRVLAGSLLASDKLVRVHDPGDEREVGVAVGLHQLLGLLSHLVEHRLDVEDRRNRQPIIATVKLSSGVCVCGGVCDDGVCVRSGRRTGG